MFCAAGARIDRSGRILQFNLHLTIMTNDYLL